MALIGSGLAACQPGGHDPTSDAVGTGVVASPASDFAAPDPRVHLVASGNRFMGRADTHAVTIDRGEIAFTPKTFAGRGQPPRAGGTLRLETVLIARGDNVVTDTFDAVQHAGAAVAVTRGDIIEQIENRADGIEQRWVVAREPAGEGDFVVQVAVSGMQFVGVTDAGLHFADDAGLGVRYGHATLVEADGDQWDLPAQWNGRAIEIAVAPDLLADAAYPVVLDPVVSAELYSDVPAVGASGQEARASDIATSGSGYFVVWADRRINRNDDIWGTRLSATGAVLDARGIKIYENATTVEANPVVAWNGTAYVVAFESDGDIRAAQVSSGGAVTQLGAVASTGSEEVAPAIAGSGGSALVTWTANGDIVGATIGASIGASVSVAAGANVELTSSVDVSPSGEYLVAYAEQAPTSRIMGQRVSAAGALTGAAFALNPMVTSAQAEPTVAHDGTNFVVAWTQSGASDLYAARVSTTAVLDAPAVAISTATSVQQLADLACTAGQCIAAWQDRRNLAASSFDVYGVALATAGPTISVGAETSVSGDVRGQYGVAVAGASSGGFAVWTDGRDGSITSIMGSRLDAGAVALDPAGLLITSGISRHSSVATTRADRYQLMVLSDSANLDFDLLGVRFTNSQVGGPFVVSNATASQIAPSVSGQGSVALAAWADARLGSSTRDIFAARINAATGTTLDPAGLAISTAAGDQLAPDVAAGATNFLVTWADRSSGDFDIYGAIVATDGSVTVPEFPICVTSGDQVRNAVAYDSQRNQFLVVWADGASGNSDIRGTRVTATGAILDGACGISIASGAAGQFKPDVAAAGGQYFVAWEDRGTDALGDIRGTRLTISTAGALVVANPSGIAVGAGSTEQYDAAVGAQGRNFFIAWTDNRGGATGYDIWGVRVSNIGQVEIPFAVSSQPGPESEADVSNAADSGGVVSIVYLRTRADLDSVRAQLRRIAFEASNNPGYPCSNNNQCASGFCVDSKCCDAACGGSVTNDCQACSVARGAQQDGTCSILAGPNVFMCRNHAEIPGLCDLREYCDGTNPTCPADVGRNQGAVCNSVSGTVCPANDASGAPHLCP